VYAVLGTLVGVAFALEGILGAPPTAFAVTAVLVSAAYSLTWLTGLGRPPRQLPGQRRDLDGGPADRPDRDRPPA
jgi:hypothetical protein